MNQSHLKQLIRLFLLTALMMTAIAASPQPGKASAERQATSVFPAGELVAPPHAFYAYAYGTPIFDVPPEILHITQFHGVEKPLNLWPYYYPAGTCAYAVGRDRDGLFFLVVIESTGQLVWVPRLEMSGFSDNDLMALSVVWMTNAPFFEPGDLLIPTND